MFIRLVSTFVAFLLYSCVWNEPDSNILNLTIRDKGNSSFTDIPKDKDWALIANPVQCICDEAPQEQSSPWANSAFLQPPA